MKIFPLLFVVAAFAMVGPSVQADEDLAVIVNASNPATPSTDQLEKIFMCTLKQWPDGMPAIPFNYSTDNPTRQLFDKIVLRLDAAEVGRFWVDQRVREGVRPPRVATDAALVLRLVTSMKGAVGYVPSSLVTPAVKVVARVRGGKFVKL